MRSHIKGGEVQSRGRPVGYAEAIGSALRSEFAERHAAKILGRWTGAGERTIKAWLAGRSCPNGDHLIKFIARSDAVLETVLAASRRVDLLEALSALRRLPARRLAPPVRFDGTDCGTGRGPDLGPVPSVPEGGLPMADRQRWFVAELLAGEPVDARSLQRKFGVSVHTAKRDIAALKAAGAISFAGMLRRRRYRLPGAPRP